MTQTEAVIAAIRSKPGITRSELFEIRVNGYRIANVTARISNARDVLAKHGETIVCHEDTKSKRKFGVRFTTYTIEKCSN